MQKKLIIFDFDGVLVHTKNIGYELHAELNPHFPREYFEDFSKGNFLENMNRAVREDGYRIQENWEDQYQERLLKLSSDEAIQKLVRTLAGIYRLTIVSSTYARHIIKKLEQEKVLECFDDILGTETHASKVHKINGLLQKYSIVPTDTIFITDTIGDIREGNECGVASIGVTWGMHDRETLLAGDPYAIVDTVPELAAAIERFFSGSAIQ